VSDVVEQSYSLSTLLKQNSSPPLEPHLCKAASTYYPLYPHWVLHGVCLSFKLVQVVEENILTLRVILKKPHSCASLY
jgi:hypothetical protein